MGFIRYFYLDNAWWSTSHMLPLCVLRKRANFVKLSVNHKVNTYEELILYSMRYNCALFPVDQQEVKMSRE